MGCASSQAVAPPRPQYSKAAVTAHHQPVAKISGDAAAPGDENLLRSLRCNNGHQLQPTKSGTHTNQCRCCGRQIKPGLSFMACGPCHAQGAPFNCCSICTNGPTFRPIFKCATPACPCDSYSGGPGDRCSRDCGPGNVCATRKHTSPSVPAYCAAPDCRCTARNGAQGQFCSDRCSRGGHCRDPVHLHPATPLPRGHDVPVPARCVTRGCPCDSSSGYPDQMCYGCHTTGGQQPCKARTHVYPPPRCVNAKHGCVCFSWNTEPNNVCCRGCSQETPCRQMHHPRVDWPACFKPGDSFEKKCREEFENNWRKRGTAVPTIVKVVALRSSAWVTRRFTATHSKLTKLRGNANEQYMYHGCPTSRNCSLFSQGLLCNEGDCAVCGITRGGVDPARVGKGAVSLHFMGKSVTDHNAVGFKRFGDAFCTTTASNKAADYCGSYNIGNGRKRGQMLLFKALCGKEFLAGKDMPTLDAPPDGYDCVYGVTKDHPAAIKGQCHLNYPEHCFYGPDNVLPIAVLFFEF